MSSQVMYFADRQDRRRNFSMPQSVSAGLLSRDRAGNLTTLHHFARDDGANSPLSNSLTGFARSANVKSCGVVSRRDIDDVHEQASDGALYGAAPNEIGRASCRERV